MLRSLPKLFLVATSFAPVLLTSGLVSFWKHEWTGGVILVALALTSVIICVGLINAAARKLSKNDITIKSIKPADKELVGFVLAYLLPLARGSQFDGFPLMVVLGVFFFVVMTSNSYHMNPLLGLLGYHFYEVTVQEVGYVLVSRRNLHNTQGIKKVVSLTDYMLLDASD